MKPSIYEIAATGRARFFIMPKPSGEWLDDDIAQFHALGIQKLVSLLTHEEAVELGLKEEESTCHRRGIRFISFPIVDRSVPEAVAFGQLVERIHCNLVDGISVAVHCRAGLGRSGALASCVLKHFGLSADEAIATVSAARGVAIPDTAEQIEFIKSYAPRRQA